MDEAEANKRIAFWETKRKACERKGDTDCVARADAAIARIKAAMGTSQKSKSTRNSKSEDKKKIDEKGGVI